MRNFILNYIGFKLPEEDLRDVPNPYTELVTHQAIKNGVRLGAFATVMAGPLAGTMLNSKHFPGIKQSMVKCGKYGLLLGIVTAPLIVFTNTAGAQEQELKEICYRRRRHRVSVQADRFYFAGAAVGMGVSTAFGAGVVFGGLMGMSVGVVFNYAFSLIDSQYESTKVPQLAK